MKQTLITLLAVIGLGITVTSCSNEMDEMKEETIQVTFQAELPKSLTTRATNTDYKVICAVFEETEKGYKEVSNLRQYATETGEGTLSYTPRLVKGRDYQIVFWASQEGAYNVTDTDGDLTNISRNENSSDLPESAFDAFTYSVPFSGTFNAATSISAPLSRPFAKINIGVTEADLEGVTNGFGQTPTTMEITVIGAYPSYDALMGEKKRNNKGNNSVTYTHSVLNGTLDEYKHLSECFVLADSNVSVTYTIKDQSGSTICTGTITDVPAKPNYNTNIVGGLMTGTVSYNITFESAFEDNEETIQSGSDENQSNGENAGEGSNSEGNESNEENVTEEGGSTEENESSEESAGEGNTSQENESNGENATEEGGSTEENGSSEESAGEGSTSQENESNGENATEEGGSTEENE